MIFSGKNRYPLPELRELSFVLNGLLYGTGDPIVTNYDLDFDGDIDNMDLSITGNTPPNSGTAAFGFSGENKSFVFNFESGRVFDPEGRFFGVYNQPIRSTSFEEAATAWPNPPSNDTTSSVLISGTLGTGTYEYSTKEDRVCCSIGKKDNFKVEQFFFNTTGCIFEGNLTVFSQDFKHEIEGQEHWLVGGNWAATIKNLENNRNLKIMDAKATSSKAYNNILPLLNFPETGLIVAAGGSENIYFDHVAGSMGEYPITVTVDTSAGKIQKSFNTVITESFIDFNYTFDVLTDFNVFSGKEISQEKTGYAFYKSQLIEGQGESSISHKDRDVKVYLDHVSGYTGTFAKINGANITYQGANYLEAPTVVFNGGDAILDASGEAVINNGIIESINITNSGLYESGAGWVGPTVTIVGGGEGVSDAETTGTAVALSGEHIKHFTGYWDVGIYPHGADELMSSMEFLGETRDWNADVSTNAGITQPFILAGQVSGPDLNPDWEDFVNTFNVNQYTFRNALAEAGLWVDGYLNANCKASILSTPKGFNSTYSNNFVCSSLLYTFYRNSFRTNENYGASTDQAGEPVTGYYKNITIPKEIDNYGGMLSLEIKYKNYDEDKMISKLRLVGYDNNEDIVYITGAILNSPM